jgi:hypothetical protein
LFGFSYKIYADFEMAKRVLNNEKKAIICELRKSKELNIKGIKLTY